MTHLHMEPEVSTIRAYSAPGGYEQRRPYDGIISVSHLTNWFAYVHGAVGKIDPRNLHGRAEYAPRSRRHHGDVRAARANENHRAGTESVNDENRLRCRLLKSLLSKNPEKATR